MPGLRSAGDALDTLGGSPPVFPPVFPAPRVSGMMAGLCVSGGHGGELLGWPGRVPRDPLIVSLSVLEWTTENVI
ncbi:hypothetical protein GCM10025784_27380 [Citricoccus nitrophenolicus]